ncbi:MAG: hypothetical protein KDE58_19880 [Caldilineaceae bacterium]|jgi:hypothetical protein|nr:hypothetical protein [Caldilineaceae bacterium]
MKFSLYIIETVTGLIFTELIDGFDAICRYLTNDDAIALYEIDGNGSPVLVLSIAEEALFA